ncbi:MAG TPA: alpha-2-macroglobulin family protein [bacterium]|nr:alpha-2-macroglobulin family protein [bacterium]
MADDGFARTRFSYPIPRSERSDRDSSDAPDVRAYTHRFSFVDPTSGQVVTNSATQIVYPTDVSVGLKTGLYFARAGEPLRVEGIVLDHDSKPVPGKSVSLELVRTEWKRIKKQGVDGLDYYDYSEVRTVESNLTISSDSNGAFSREFSPKSAGSYQVRAVYRGANGLSSLAARSIYVSGTDMVYWNDGNSSISDLISDKREYRPGETASLRFKAPIATGSLLVTVEKDDVILSTFTVPVSESLVPIEVPIKPEYLPNVYVKVLFVGRADPTGLPTVARGLANLNVLTGDKRLSVAISTDKRYYAPQDPMFVTVRISDAAGNPVSGAVGSLAVVDESLLALVGNPTLDPYSFFYVVKRFLGVSTASSLARLIEKLEIPDASDGEKGGGSMAGETRRLRGDFRDTAYWTAEYQTDDKGVAVVSVPNLPDNLTDWRIETVADASDRFGVGYATASTRRPVMLSSNLPNFFAEGDTMVLRPILSNRTDTPREFTVTLSSNIFATGSVLSRSVRIPAGADVPVELPVRVRPVREMPATLSAAVSMEMVDISDASMRDGETLTLPIAVSTMPEVTTTFGLVTGGAGQDERIRLSADEKDGILRINYAPSVFSYARSSFGFFSSYPYGCAEQITSSILPHVYEKQLADALDIPLDLKTHTIESYDRLLEASVRTTVDSALREYLSSIRAYQHSDGGIQYWKTTSEQPSYWLTSYVLDGLFEIERIGYEVDSGMVSRMISYLIFQFDNDLSKYAAMPVEGSEYPSDNAPKYSLEDHFSTIQVLARYDARNGTNESVGRFSAVLSESERRSGPMESRSLSERESFLETLAAVMATPGVPDSEKRAMRDRAAAMVETIFSDSLVINTRGAFLAERADDSRYARLDRTLRFVGIASMPDILDGRVDIREILPRMLRWAASETDDDGSYGTTMLSAAAVRTFARYLASTGELIDVNMTAKVFVNDRIIDETTIDASNKLGSQTKTIDLADLPENTSVRFERSGSGGIAYDLSLERRVPMLGAGAKSYGFLVKRSYYDATEYDRIRDAKSAEWDRYVRGEIDSTTLVYPNDPMEYLTPLERIPASGLIYASYRIVTPEARDFVAFEAQIPAGTMLVNPRLATDSGGKTVLSNPMFSYEEYRLDRYFGFARSLSAGEYEIRFALRATHRGTFFVPPARAFQFYEPESFGRSEASTLTVQ